MTVQDDAGRRRPRRAGRDKREVLTAAARVIAERGADATRFTDVSAASGVPVSTLQYYFGSREDLLAAAFRYASETELRELRAELARIPEAWDRLVRIVDVALASYAAGHGLGGHLWVEAWRFGMRDAEMRQDVLRDYAEWRALVAAAIREGRFPAAPDPAQVALLLVSLVDGLGMPLALGDPDASVADARDAVLAMLHGMLGA
jgi:AcrR family transcriptional regulator